MKTLLLPLLAAAPILAALAPQARAGAIATGSLQPRRLGPASLQQRSTGGIPVPVFRTPRVNASNEINNSLLSGGVLKTGSGTLTISSANTFTVGSVSLSGSSVFDSGGLTLSGTLSTRGSLQFSGGSVSSGWTAVDPAAAVIWLNGSQGTIDTNGTILVGNPGTLTLDGFNVKTAGHLLTATGSGTLTLEGLVGTRPLLGVSVLAGTLDFESAQTLDGFVIDGGTIVTLAGNPQPPAAAPAAVPEPASAMLCAIGMLAVSCGRRRAA